MVGGTLRGGSAETIVVGVASVADAGPDQISWLSDPKYTRALKDCRAAALIVAPTLDTGGVPAILSHDPEGALNHVLQRMGGVIERPADVHATAVISRDARLGEGVRVGAHVRIGEGTRIGPRCIIHAGTHIASDCRLGDDCE